MSKSTYEQQFSELQPQATPKGVRLDLRLYVYPDGHGNILIEGQDQNYPASSSAVASDVFSGIWQRACEVSEKKLTSADDHGLQPELVAWLETLGIQPRKPIGALALQQMFKQRGLLPTEMSDGIVSAREE